MLGDETIEEASRLSLEGRVTSDVAIEEVTSLGIVGRGDQEAVLDVLFDGRPVWSLHFRRDSDPDGDRRFAAWPESLKHHLNGVTTVAVRHHLTGALLYEEERRFGQGIRRIAIVDEQGRTLSVNAKGKLTALLSQRGPDVIETMLDAAEDVLGRMRDCGVDGFLAYGTLLGAVRTGHVIEHDYDADLSYLSRHEHPVDLIRESYRIERAIQAAGYATARYSGISFQVALDPEDPEHPWLDVFGALISGGMLYVMGQVGAPVRRDQVLPLGTRVLEGRELPVPRDVDAWLTATYGPSWRTPDPAFHFDTPRGVSRRLGGWFRGMRRKRTRWDSIYQYVDESSVSKEPSEFARWVSAAVGEGTSIVDIGCGLGTDVLWFAGQGRFSTGLDFSRVALLKARARAHALPVSFESVNLADLRSVFAAGAALARGPQPRALTGRYVVDGLNPAERENLWLLARMVLRPGGNLYLEIADVRDARYRSFATAQRLQRLPARVLRSEIQKSGGMVLWRGHVDSPRDSEVPDSIRMVVAWPT